MCGVVERPANVEWFTKPAYFRVAGRPVSLKYQVACRTDSAR